MSLVYSWAVYLALGYGLAMLVEKFIDWLLGKPKVGG